MSGEVMAAEMAEQPDVLRRLLARLPELAESVRGALPRRLAGSVLIARGSSDNAAVFGRYLYELASERPAGLGSPSLVTRYGARTDYTDHLVTALSQSGRTPEIVTTVQAARERGARIIAVTNEADSALAAAAHVVAATEAGTEVAVPATKTVTAQMLALVGIATALGPLPANLVDPADLAELPDAVGLVLADTTAVDTLAADWARHDRLVVAGRGLGGAVALEGALKIRETSGVFAEGISVADLLHGPIAALSARVPVLLIDVGGPTSPDIAALRERLDRDGIPHATVSPSLPALRSESARAIATTVRLQQIARAFALRRGADPDAPAGLAKVTATN
ncbi:SIS domain-containing protein [Streptomyces sp. SID3343]|uniref:SIS domain-containing protein n=1 Tax=Streptomyces sp. SID3343 TaxID=2690260 RepID=UPI00136AB8B3|nr:SIS domain-containing protein [Streptomyces sp. SID3343]MYW03966.1 SIS domain-containing protein [Streptomyces sp. SID3343]